MNLTTRRFTLLTGLGILGAIVSVYQTYHFHTVRAATAGFSTFCNINELFNCTAVENSRYAEFLFGIPLSAFAVAWYVAWLVFAWWGHDPTSRKQSVSALTAVTAIATALSAIYFFIMFQVLQKFCLLCLAIDAINVLGFVVVLSLRAQTARQESEKASWTPYAWVLVSGAVIGLLVNLILQPNGMAKQDVQDFAHDVLSTPPVAIRPGDSRIGFGTSGAPITIAKFSDFQCPACKRGAYVIHAAMERYPGQIQVLYRNQPWDQTCNPHVERGMHPNACIAAKIAICAAKVGKFEAVYRLFFDRQEQMSPENLMKWAEEAGLEASYLKSCTTSAETQNVLLEDTEEAKQLNVNGTPTMFINGRRMEGPGSPEILDLIIKGLLPK